MGRGGGVEFVCGVWGGLGGGRGGKVWWRGSARGMGRGEAEKERGTEGRNKYGGRIVLSAKYYQEKVVPKRWKGKVLPTAKERETHPCR